jgi:voltage-gated potassium channel
MHKPQMDIETARRIRRNFRLLALATLGAVTTGAVFMHFQEKLSWVDSIYFSVVSLTTVGYGDIVPKTDIGKIFVCFYLLVGIGIIAAFASNLIKNAVAKRVIKQSDQQ